MSDKVYRKDEPVFVASRYPQYSCVVDPGGAVQLGGRIQTVKPRYADFHPHPAVGGIFRVTAKAAKKLKMTQDELLAALRERDSIDSEFVEVKSDEHFLSLTALRADIVKDNADRPVIKARQKVDAPAAPNVREPESAKQKAPGAAQGPAFAA